MLQMFPFEGDALQTTAEGDRQVLIPVNTRPWRPCTLRRFCSTGVAVSGTHYLAVYVTGADIQELPAHISQLFLENRQQYLQHGATAVAAALERTLRHPRCGRAGSSCHTCLQCQVSAAEAPQ